MRILRIPCPRLPLTTSHGDTAATGKGKEDESRKREGGYFNRKTFFRLMLDSLNTKLKYEGQTS